MFQHHENLELFLGVRLLLNIYKDVFLDFPSTKIELTSFEMFTKLLQSCNCHSENPSLSKIACHRDDLLSRQFIVKYCNIVIELQSALKSNNFYGRCLVKKTPAIFLDFECALWSQQQHQHAVGQVVALLWCSIKSYTFIGIALK